MDQDKAEFLKMLGRASGEVKKACAMAGVPRSSYYHWRKTDPEFAGQCDIVIASHKEKQKEERRQMVFPDAPPGGFVPVLRVTDKEGDPAGMELPEAERYKGPSAASLAEDHERYLRTAMEAAGIFDEAYTPQVKAASKLHASIEILFSQLDRFEPLQTELSREGNPRLVSNPIHEMIRRQTDTYTGILKTLGLNFESKAKPKEEDGLAGLMDLMKEDAEPHGND